MSVIFARAAAAWADMRDDYDRAIQADYDAAAEATNDRLLTPEGQREGISSFSLFTGPVGRAYRYASPELVDYWQHHPRRTLAAFERQWADSMGVYA